MGVTKFTDLTEEEFSQYVNKFKFSQKSGHSKNIFKTSLDLSLPHKIDWSERGAVTNVKDQGHCGSSWAFSATGTMEGQAALQLKQHLFLSEQNLIDCVTEEYGGNGCNGGDIIGAYLYVDYYGIDSEDNYNYHGHQYNCQQKNAVFYVAGYEEVERDEHSLQQATAKVGPISVGIDATNKLQNYISGIFIDDTCSNQTNHAVLVVGYGSEGGLDYWIVKNSWGVNWGEQGYFRLIRNSNACGIATMGSYPLVNL
ncbi:hypothetical protein HHI36_000011 [Cryptolaemus montrouzieri]|uniref:Peptidase C1A papain C-terminal domain-containing protein n=1 Tax=Cryptolaemus montrouzieri TaxID=559131 RepID=A0ABD2P3L7_9CUCU